MAFLASYAREEGGKESCPFIRSEKPQRQDGGQQLHGGHGDHSRLVHRLPRDRLRDPEGESDVPDPQVSTKQSLIPLMQFSLRLLNLGKNVKNVARLLQGIADPVKLNYVP